MVNPQVSTYFEVTGSLQQHPVSELLGEICAAGLSGSVRLEKGEHKVIVYFDQGKLVYAASNSRQHRLFDLLLRMNQVTKEQITACKDFINDQLLAAQLIEKKLCDKEAFTYIFREQLREIVNFTLGWNEGNWHFNALARIKEEVWQEIDLENILLDVSKKMSTEDLAKRFDLSKDVFSIASKDTATQQTLSSQEYFVLSRLDQPSNIQDISLLTGFSEAEVIKIIYGLWMAGFVNRGNWEAAFSRQKIDELLSAEIKVKEKPKKVEAAPAVQVSETASVEEAADGGEVTIEKYLEQVEKAETFYDVLGVFQDSPIAEIKANYFTFAKKFHPDKYHAEAGSRLHQRIQHAFTQISQSYDTLKDPESREVYNFKMRRELEKLQKRKELIEEMKAEGKGIDESNEAEINKLQQAREEFDYGFNYLMNQDLAAAVPFLARAVNLAPKQARYHAYYGKALSYLDKNRHQAEKEIVTAIKIEPQNTSYRIMLIEFYIDVNMPKRAEGELKKLLAKEPGNEEAKALMESLQIRQ